MEDLHSILTNLYDQMMPLCGDMSNLARVIAGMGSMVYITIRIGSSLADGKQIEFFPLLKLFIIGMSIAMFPTVVLGTLNLILGSVSKGTESILDNEKLSLQEFVQDMDRKNKEAEGKAYLVDDEEFDKELEGLGWSPDDLSTMTKMFIERGLYNVKKNIYGIITEVLNLIFQAASLIIDTIRTFFLVVLSILGPISFALSLWEGFGGTISYWLSRYIQVYLWLPVSNILSCILSRLQLMILQNDVMATSSVTYIIFMIMGIVGYFKVPTVSEWVVQAAGGVGSYSRTLNDVTSKARSMVIGKFK